MVKVWVGVGCEEWWCGDSDVVGDWKDGGYGCIGVGWMLAGMGLMVRRVDVVVEFCGGVGFGVGMVV